MMIELHNSYPKQIKNPDGVILAVKLLPCGLPKEGPKVATFAVPFAVVFAASLWDNQGTDVAHWDWYVGIEPETRQCYEEYVRAADLNPNVWYFLDIFDGE